MPMLKPGWFYFGKITSGGQSGGAARKRRLGRHGQSPTHSFYNVFVNSLDVIIAGAGIIGVSLGLELRERGAKVLILDRGQPGSEASSAAAGMLAAGDPETPPALRALAWESARMFPEYVRNLEGLSGITTDFRQQGTIVFGEQAAPAGCKQLSSDELRQREPHLQSHGLPAFFVQEDSVDPFLLMQAALAAARNLGVEIRGHAAVKDIRPRDALAEVLSDAERFAARSVVDCRGAWSGAPVRPRKGQMLYVQPRTAMLQHVLRAPDVYLVPRSSGKVLVGATVEDVGYDKSVDPATIHSLLSTAAKYLPELGSAPIIQSWAGLRPGTPDNLPIMGPTETPGVFAASGHFRNGILLAPITAKIMADLVEGQPSPLNIGAFVPSRFRSALK